VVGRGKRVKIGELLVQAERINSFQLDSALSHQRNCGGRLGESLIKLGYISEDELLSCLAEQLKLPRVNLFKHEVSEAVLACLPADKAREFHVLPVDRREVGGTSVLLVAMTDPTNLTLIDALQFITGCRVKPVLAPEADIRDAIRHYYSVTPDPEAAPATTGAPVAVRVQPTPLVPGAAAVGSAEAKLQALLKLLLEKGVLSLREYERLK